MAVLINKIKELLDTKLSIWVSIVVFCAVTIITYGVIEARATYQNSHDIDLIKGELQQRINFEKRFEYKHDEDINDVYKFILEIQPTTNSKSQTKIITPEWSKNRDEQIRNQMAQLRGMISELTARIHQLENK